VSRPSVSIIVLNWNGRSYLAECLGSLRRQTYEGPHQVVLVDNGSQDGSADYVEAAFPEVRLIRSPVNLGFAAGNNLAARQLDTDLLAFLNNDTRTDPGWLEELVRSVTAAPDVACAGGRILSWDGKTVDFMGGGATLTGLGIQFGYGQPASADAPAGDILFACGGSMIVKRDPYLQVGGLDDDTRRLFEQNRSGRRRGAVQPDDVLVECRGLLQVAAFRIQTDKLQTKLHLKVPLLERREGGFHILARSGKVQRAALGHSQQPLNLCQAGLPLKRGAKVGNGVGCLSLEKQQNAQICLRIHIFRIDGHGGLELRNRLGGLLCIEVAFCLLHVRRKLLMLVLGHLGETQTSGQQQDEPSKGNSTLRNHSEPSRLYSGVNHRA